MERIPIQSRVIQSNTHDSASDTLYVGFRNGEHRIHPNVSVKMLENLISAESPGFYYSYHLYEPAVIAKRSYFRSPNLLAKVFGRFSDPCLIDAGKRPLGHDNDLRVIVTGSGRSDTHLTTPRFDMGGGAIDLRWLVSLVSPARPFRRARGVRPAYLLGIRKIGAHILALADIA